MIQAVFGGFWRFWALFTPLFAHDLRFCRFCRDREQKGVWAMACRAGAGRGVGRVVEFGG